MKYTDSQDAISYDSSNDAKDCSPVLPLAILTGVRVAIRCGSLVMAHVAPAGNPILPGTAFIPDGEPHVFNDNGEHRVFLYGSKDDRVTHYCGPSHDVWSAPARDLTRWTNHGEIINI